MKGYSGNAPAAASLAVMSAPRDAITFSPYWYSTGTLRNSTELQTRRESICNSGGPAGGCRLPCQRNARPPGSVCRGPAHGRWPWSAVSHDSGGCGGRTAPRLGPMARERPPLLHSDKVLHVVPCHSPGPMVERPPWRELTARSGPQQLAPYFSGAPTTAFAAGSRVLAAVPSVVAGRPASGEITGS